MTHAEAILDFLESHGGEATLGEMLQAGYGSWAHKLTARISDLRKQGFRITCEKGPNPSKNLYRIENPEPRFQFDQFNQGILI